MTSMVCEAGNEPMEGQLPTALGALADVPVEGCRSDVSVALAEEESLAGPDAYHVTWPLGRRPLANRGTAVVHHSHSRPSSVERDVRELVQLRLAMEKQTVEIGALIDAERHRRVHGIEREEAHDRGIMAKDKRKDALYVMYLVHQRIQRLAQERAEARVRCVLQQSLAMARREAEMRRAERFQNIHQSASAIRESLTRSREDLQDKHAQALESSRQANAEVRVAHANTMRHVSDNLLAHRHELATRTKDSVGQSLRARIAADALRRHKRRLTIEKAKAASRSPALFLQLPPPPSSARRRAACPIPRPNVGEQ